MELKNLKDNDSGGFFILLPISIGFLIVLVINIAVKLGVGVPDFLLMPVTQLWIIIMGVVVAFGLFMRQIFMTVAIIIISLILTFIYWALYLL